MTKHFCDICGAEMEEDPIGRAIHLKRSVRFCWGFGIISGYRTVCEPCMEFVSNAIKSRQNPAAQKTSPISLVKFTNSYKEKCDQCINCSSCRFHASRYGDSQMCVVRYAEALESGEMTLADGFGRINNA